jgi:hypothetical protein
VKPTVVALVAPADSARAQIAKYLRDRGYDVHECEELSIATRFTGVVLVDRDDDGEAARASVSSWFTSPKPIRVVVISVKPARWRALQLALGDELAVLTVPAFGWEVVDALRAGLPRLPRPA